MIFEFNGGPLDGNRIRLPCQAISIGFAWTQIEGLAKSDADAVEDLEMIGEFSARYDVTEFHMQDGDEDHTDTVAVMHWNEDGGY